MSTGAQPAIYDPPALPPPYYEQQRVRGWTVPVSPLVEYRLLRAWGDKDYHVHMATIYMMAGLQADASHARLVDEASALYGDYGPRIGGGLRDHWPQKVKALVRSDARAAANYAAASVAHWQAAGRRTHTWRRLRDEAKSAATRGQR